MGNHGIGQKLKLQFKIIFPMLEKVPLSMLAGKCSVEGVSSPACGLWGWYWDESSPNPHDPSYDDYVSRWSAYDDS